MIGFYKAALISCGWNKKEVEDTANMGLYRMVESLGREHQGEVVSAAVKGQMLGERRDSELRRKICLSKLESYLTLVSLSLPQPSD